MAGLLVCTLSAFIIGSITHPVQETSLLIPSIKKAPAPPIDLMALGFPILG